jgi:hypothetical protein
MIYQNSPPVNEFFEYAWSVEPGYLLFNSIHRSVFDSGFLYLLMYSALQAILLIILFKKNRNPALFLIVYIILFYLNFHFNILRAGTATLFLLLALQAGNFSRALTLFLVGLLFHISIVVAFPLLLVDRRFSFRQFILAFGFFTTISLAISYLLLDYVIIKIIGYLGKDFYGGSTYPVIFIFTALIFISTIVLRKGRVPLLYIFSGSFLLASLLFNFFFPEFYRITLIFLIVYFWYLIDSIKLFSSVYSFAFYLFFLYHSSVTLTGVYTEKARLQAQLNAGDVRITSEVLRTTYIPYDFYWNDL